MTELVELLARIERTYDGLPRRPGVRVEASGPFEIFVREGEGWPFYARPRLGSTTFTTDDVELVLARQRELAVAQAIEWVIEVSPGLLEALPPRMSVVRAPLMVLDPARLADTMDSRLRFLHPDDPDAAQMYALSAAVAHIGFGHPGTAAGTAGPAERDAAVVATAPPTVAAVEAGIRVEAVLVDPVEGVVARGGYQAALGAAEIAGVATLPSARRQGLAAAVTAILARHALEHGNDLVFLSAADEDVARGYARVGFGRVGTAGIAEVP